MAGVCLHGLVFYSYERVEHSWPPCMKIKYKVFAHAVLILLQFFGAVSPGLGMTPTAG